jgi:hypothetical protein
MAIQPIFILSAVRSGSTLVQRILAAHEEIATVSEPWLLLPHACALQRKGIDAGYLHPFLADATEDFCEQLPGGEDQYLGELRECALRLYESAAGDRARYFVDKSPPYCFIAEEVMRLFPEGKFVFLWRNPLSIVSSIIETWQPWRPTLFREDLFIGLPRLVAAYAAHRERAHAVRFEDLVSGDESRWQALMSYIGAPFAPDALARFSQVGLEGRMGDPTGPRLYSKLSSEPEHKWKTTMANPLRREWCRRYLGFLGEERLATMGYDRDRLLLELEEQPISAESLLGDVGRLLKDVAKEPIRVRMRSYRGGNVHAIRKLLAATALGRVNRATDAGDRAPRRARA